MTKAKTKVLLNNTIMMYILSIAKLVIPLISLPYLTRVLTVECYGSVAFARSIIGYMQILIDFGFLLSGTKDIINIMKRGESPKKAIGDTLYAQLILCLLATGIMLICSFCFDILHGYEFFALLSLVPVILSVFLFEYVFKAHEQMGKIAVKYILMRVIALVLTLIFVKNDSHIFLMPVFDIIASLVAIVLVFFQLKKLGVQINFNIRRIKSALLNLRKSFVYFISNFATTAFLLLNTLIIGIMLSKSDVAYWNVALQLVTAVQALYTPVTQSVFPTMIKERDLSIVHKIMLIYMPLIFIGCGLILTIGDWAIALVLTEKYLMSAKLLKYLIPLLIFSFPAMLYGWPCLGAIDKQKANSLTTIISACIQVFGLLVLVLINQFNLMGVCIVRNITEMSLCAMRMGIVYYNKSKFCDIESKNNKGGSMEERSEELIDRIHAIEFDLLEKFDEVCKKLNIRYSLSSGSLLGAVRHKGFIPWDDDVDIAMPRDDYERFIKEAGALLPEGYFLQHFTTNKYCTNSFAKIRNSNTTWIYSIDIKKPEHNMGFGLDVFPVDRVENEKCRKKLSRSARFCNLLRYDYKFNPKRHPGFIRKVRSVFAFILARILGRYRINKLQDKQEKKYNKGEYTCADSMYKTILLPYKIFEEYTTIEFEGKQFSCIKEYDLYLRATYGDDYMQLPPPENRKTHLAEIVDCDKPYTHYLKN